jgi:regulator of replication initiation timing
VAKDEWSGETMTGNELAALSHRAQAMGCTTAEYAVSLEFKHAVLLKEFEAAMLAKNREIATLERDLGGAVEDRDALTQSRDRITRRLSEEQMAHGDTKAELARMREVLTNEYRVENILGQWVCDSCGGVWPEHKPHCVIGQTLVAPQPAPESSDHAAPGPAETP